MNRDELLALAGRHSQEVWGEQTAEIGEGHLILERHGIDAEDATALGLGNRHDRQRYGYDAGTDLDIPPRPNLRPLARRSGTYLVPDPATLDEYVARFHENTKIHGYGLDVTQVVPCPFCAAPDFATWQVAAGILSSDKRPNLDEQMGTETTCIECGRSGRHVVFRDPNGVSIEFVQTGGPDPADYLPPMRRV